MVPRPKHPKADAAAQAAFKKLRRTVRRVASELTVPANMRLINLPPYSPELNLAEHLWDSLREDCFGNHVVANLDAV